LVLTSFVLDLYIQFIKLDMFTAPAFENYFDVWNVWVREISGILGVDIIFGAWPLRHLALPFYFSSKKERRNQEKSEYCCTHREWCSVRTGLAEPQKLRAPRSLTGRL
jgi:hypothetical protein